MRIEPGYSVFVGYADNVRPDRRFFPTPFDTGSGVASGRASAGRS